MFPFYIETIVTLCMALLFLAKTHQTSIKAMVDRVGFNLTAAMELLQICPNNKLSFIGSLEFFASVPAYQDPAANLNRTCPSSPITIDPAILITPTTTPTTSADPTVKDGPSTKVSARSVACVSHGDGLLSFAVLVTLCGMLLL